MALRSSCHKKRRTRLWKAEMAVATVPNPNPNPEGGFAATELAGWVVLFLYFEVLVLRLVYFYCVANAAK